MVLTELPKTALKLLNNLNFFLSDQAYFIVLMFKLFVCQTFTTSPMMAVGTPFCIPFGNNTLGLMRFSFKPVFWFHQHTNGAKFKRRGSSFVLPYINVNTFLRLHWWFFRGHIRFPPKGAFIQLLLLQLYSWMFPRCIFLQFCQVILHLNSARGMMFPKLKTLISLSNVYKILQ